MLQKGDQDDPEIQILQEQLFLYDAAATIISKVFKGYLTRKYLCILLKQQYESGDEEDEVFDENNYLEENQIEPDELLEGNNLNFNYIQQTKNIQEIQKYDQQQQLNEYTEKPKEKNLEEEIKKLKETKKQQFELIKQQLKNIQKDSKLTTEVNQQIENLYNQLEKEEILPQNDNFLLKEDQIDQIIFKREEVIDSKHQKELEIIQKLHEKNHISPKKNNIECNIESTNKALNQIVNQQDIYPKEIENINCLEYATLNYIKDYLVAFSEYIKDNFKDEFLSKINIPIGIDSLEFLKAFNLTENLENSSQEILQTPIYPVIKYIQIQKTVISEEIFLNFNEIFNKDNNLLSQELIELEKFHMKMTFDCFNEALDSMRPFGLRGKPLPWKININKLCSIKITQDNIEKIFGLAIAKVLKWGSSLCGFIPERIESPTGEIIQIDDDYLNQIKEDRLAQMLENEVLENEDKWLLYEDEETDVQLEISDEIFNSLIQEIVDFITGNKEENKQMIDLQQNLNIFQNNNKSCVKAVQNLGLCIKDQQIDQKMIDKQIFLINMQSQNINKQEIIQGGSQKDQNSSF
ncbi:IQ calmodulin-binding motif family protein, putative [Ichthyophthirius multifiliis]|uniref:IQ calmodulin-binding motif family protein, putative n=1 Tax=Ichthyophthirius multifiliis TaxID=5932 RepID=G0QV97_ICHMU|nr:IQ calmodulin-binding motif family protein, putative [Ichthyophthirius multifiliis]EGR30855.1 IQ calmodulin-binding motif family protein, putative [Ichthyophthirius multifiliis]|eukprot:XP_004032442.1 IQ calmodulin-binding motif family protein, putative [Ichthyophthirius multifiliis]